jgi:DNA-binding GntR family transcriptional regulator
LYTIRGVDAETMSARGARRTMAEVVYQALKRDLITLRHQPGAALTEQGLAERYGSSRVPVREACRRLQQEGLLTAVPYKGYFVDRVSLKDIYDSFELRLALESHALARAAERATAEELGRLAELAATEYTFHDWESYTEFLERNEDFHVQLAALSGNHRLVTALRDLIGTMQRFFMLGLDLGDFAAEMRGEHEELVALLQAGRVDAAVACLRQQILASRDRILKALVSGRIDLPLE